MDPRSKVGGPRSKVQGRRSKVGGPRSEVQGPRSKVQGPRSKVQGRRSKVGGPRSEVQGPRSNVQGPRSKVQGPRSEVQGPRSLKCYEVKVMQAVLANNIAKLQSIARSKLCFLLHKLEASSRSSLPCCGLQLLWLVSHVCAVSESRVFSYASLCSSSHAVRSTYCRRP